MNVRSVLFSGVAGAWLASAAFAAAPADPEKSLQCSGRMSDTRNRVCEMKEIPLPATGRLTVNAAPNGGISVRGWTRAEVLVRARIEAWGDSDADARATLAQVRVNTAGNSVEAEGPKQWGQQRWSVTYEVFAPERTDLNLRTVNGGLSAADLRGNIEMTTSNGGLKLARLAGRVKADTTNGGVSVELTGQTWDGESLEVSTTNGGVSLEVPAAYNARIEARTTNGGMSSDLPAQISGKSWGPKSMSIQSGAGGPMIKVVTTNGGVRVRQKKSV
jgi:hypothetical protein